MGQWKFPARVAAGRSIVPIQRCNWHFNRFRAERYFALAPAEAVPVARKLGRHTTVDQYLNAIGNVAMITFVTLMLTVSVPFRCLTDPNGTKVRLRVRANCVGMA